MKNLNNKKENIIAIITFIVTFFLVFFFITKGKFLYGSTTDWESQHYLIPEYFRNLFYKTGNLFPDFAFNIGAGQNIYYFSYYGLLSPLILLSYLLPFIKMVTYIQILGCLIPIVSTILFYFYLRKHNNFKTSYLVSLMFLFASPIIFHSHRHLMFINYMPFMMISLFAIDKFFEKNKISLLIVSIFLIIMTSYYYSVGALLGLFLYAIYYGYKNNKLNKKIIFKLLCAFIIGVMMALIIILPTLYTLLNGRDSNSTFDLIKILIPRKSFRFLLYGSYSIGLSALSLLGIIYTTISRKKEEVIFGIFILLLTLFPIFNYILNGTLYIDSKSLIPFLPIILIYITPFIDNVIKGNINVKKIINISLCLCVVCFSKRLILDLLFVVLLIIINYYKKIKKSFMFIMFLFLFLVCIFTNNSDKLENRNVLKSKEFKNIDPLIKEIVKEENNIYRINNQLLRAITMNKITDENQYVSTLYSSIFNKDYNKFYYDTFNNAIPFRNRSMTPASLNPLYQIYMGEKYVISNSKKILGAKKIKSKNKINIFEHEKVLPIGYASSNLLSSTVYEKLGYPENVLNLLKYVVVDDGSSDYLKINEEEADYEILDKANVDYKDGKMIAKENAYIKIKLNKDYHDKLFFIRFKNNTNPSCKMDELNITINGIKNKLSCKTWKYHNQNYVFDYVVYDTNILNIKIGKGKYDISDFHIYSISKDEIYSLIDGKDEFIINKDQTKDNVIVGKIDVKKDGYFTMSIPYDKGFKAYIDNELVDVEKVNTTFIGFKISEGHHNIKIIYEAPFKKISLLISSIFTLIFVLIFIKELKKK